jgi:hypothetical protein
MNDSPTDEISPPWVRVSENRYIHSSGACYERRGTWKRTGFWIGVIAVAEALAAGWLLSCVP